MVITNYNYNLSEITSQIIDDSGTKYIWIAFKSVDGNTCKLYKASAHNPIQKYYDLDVPVNQINAMAINTTKIYLAVSSLNYLGYIYTKNTPLTAFVAINKPEEITETPISVAIDSSYAYFLTPGSISGTITKIIKTSLGGTVDEIIELSKSGEEINNAVSLTIEGTNLWIVTEDTPCKLVRVYQDSGIYNFQVHEIAITF
jgi:hypothetical protein